MNFMKWQMKKKDEETLEMLYEEANDLEKINQINRDFCNAFKS